MALKAEFVGIHEAADIIDRVIRLRDPEGHALALAGLTTHLRDD